MKRWLIAIALLLVAGGAGWWFGSPWWTLYQMKTAVEQRDFTALSSHIDYTAVRDDVGRQLKERLSLRGGPAESLLAGALTRGLAGEVVKPEALGALAGIVGGLSGMEKPRAEDFAMHRDGLDQFRMVSRREGGGAFVFRRHGVGWKLSGVTLPTRFEPSWLRRN